MAVTKKAKAGGAGKDMRAFRHAVRANVIISIGAATALLILVNVVGHLASSKHKLRWNMETLGRYGLSETGKRVLDQVDQPVRVTSIYTSVKPDRKPEQYLPQVRDLLEELRQYKADLTAVNVASDRGKAEVVARLRERLDKAAEKHRKLIEAFQIFAQTQESLYAQELQKWQAYPATGWLGRFGLPKAFETYLDGSSKAMKKLAALIRQELSGAALPDYPGLAGQIKDTLAQVRGVLEKIGRDLRQLADLPEKVREDGKMLLEAAKSATAEFEKAIAAAGKPGSPAPAEPGKALEQIAAATRAAAEAADRIAQRLVQLDAEAGKQLRNLDSWGQAAVSLSQLAGDASNVAGQLEQVRVAVKVDLQKKVIVEQLRPGLPKLAERARAAEAALAQMIQELTQPDKLTQEKFQQAKKPDFLQPQLKPVRELLAQCTDLGELADQTELIEQITEDNIVLVEVGEQVGVVPFDDAWPLAQRSEFDISRGAEEQERRIFNGDMAICSKILNMTAEPFAEVVLTFYEEMPPQYMGQRGPISGPIPSKYVQTLRERLEKANVQVKDWNVAREDAPAADKDRPQVLLVLPPPDFQPPMMGPQQMPRFGPEHVDKLKKAIARGTPAIFLAGYLRPRFWGQMGPPEFGWGEYLKQDWGLEVRTDLRVVLGERDPLEPGKFLLPVLRWDFLPLSTFAADHPVGKPLRARRFYWLSTCPIMKAEKPPAGLEVGEILTVPGDLDNMWASAQAERLWERVVSGRGTGVAPDTDSGDVRPPFALAVEATKEVNGKRTSVIVLGVGLSYIDGFLTYRIPQIKGGQTLATEPPPTGDVDLVVNSVYHLIGKGEFIGAGPTIVQPIRLISRGTLTLVKIVFGFVWPALMLVAGGAVLLARKR